MTADEVRARAEELRAATGWGPTAKVASVARAWGELARLMERRGGTVADLDPDAVAERAESSGSSRRAAACSRLHGPSATHDHSHGLVADSIKRSREGVRAVLLALGVLALTAVVQALVLVASGSVALLADLIHNLGDASTAIPSASPSRCAANERSAGPAWRWWPRSSRARAWRATRRSTGSSTRATWTTWSRWPLPAWWASEATGSAAVIRSRAGRRLDSPALVADGAHARADAYVSLAVVASALCVAAGLQAADPLIGLAITVVILRITWQSWRTIRAR